MKKCLSIDKSGSLKQALSNLGFDFSYNESQVATSHKDEYEQLNTNLKNVERESKLLLSKSFTEKVQFII